MTESKETFVKIDKILRHVQSLDGQTSFLVRAHAKELTQGYIDYFLKKQRAIRVFLLIDGKLSVSEISDKLNLHVQAVSNEITVLERAGLTYLKHYQGKKKIYAKEPVCNVLRLDAEFERILRNGKAKSNPKRPKSRKRRVRR